MNKMADGNLVPGLDGQQLVGVMSGFTTFIMYALVGVVLAGLVWWVLWLLSFKHKVRVRKIINGHTVVVDDLARQFKKDGVPMWKFKKTKYEAGVPPSNVIDITNKGKLIAECFVTSDGTIIWRQNVFNEEEFKKTHPDFEPFTPEERSMLVHQFRQAESYKKKNWMSLLADFSGPLAVVLILVVFMIFFNQTVKPTMEMGDKLVIAIEKIDSAMGKIESVCLDRPTLKNENTTVSKVGGVAPN